MTVITTETSRQYRGGGGGYLGSETQKLFSWLPLRLLGEENEETKFLYIEVEKGER